MSKNERTKKMMSEFISQRESGKTIDEISKIYGVSKVTVYGRLQEIADANGVTRESLLTVPQKEHILVKSREYDAKKRIDAIHLKERFDKMISEADVIINTIDEVLTENAQEES